MNKEELRLYRIEERRNVLLKDKDRIGEIIENNSDIFADEFVKSSGNVQTFGIFTKAWLRLQCYDIAEEEIDFEGVRDKI